MMTLPHCCKESTVWNLLRVLWLLALVSLISPAVLSPPASADTELEKPREHGGFFSLAYSPDGRYVAGGTGKITATSGGKTRVAGGEVVVWSAKTGKIVKTMGGGDTSSWVQFSGDGKYIAAVTNDKPAAMIWSLRRKTGRPLAIKLRGPFPWNVPPIFSHDGNTLITVAEVEKKFGEKKVEVNGELSVWNVARRKVRWSVKDSFVEAMALSPDGKTLAGFVQVVNWRLNEKGRLRGKRGKSAIVLWDARKGKVKGEIENVRSMGSLAFLPDGKTFAGVDRRRLVLWDVESLESKSETELKRESSPTAIVFSRDGHRAAIPRFMGRVVDIWDMKRNRLLLQLTGKFPKTYSETAFSPKLDRMACKHGHDLVIIDLKYGSAGGRASSKKSTSR